MSAPFRTGPALAKLARDRSGVALIEFAFVLPLLLVLSLTGAELTNYVITRMRVSQLALHLADNAARIGVGAAMQAKEISEADINDLLTGAGLQAGALNLYGQGRVIVSSLEPMANPNPTGKYRIRWQRCRGAKAAHGSSYGLGGARDLSGMGPANRQVIAPDNGATMFVEVYYEYQPLVRNNLAPSVEIVEIASMMVRDRRALDVGDNGVLQIAGVPRSACA